MSLILWIVLYLVSTVLSWWIVWGGAASRLEGWPSWLVIDWKYPWTADQIAFYFLMCWLGQTLWFVVGLFVPEARLFL
jgi:hypothetical protein